MALSTLAPSAEYISAEDATNPLVTDVATDDDAYTAPEAATLAELPDAGTTPDLDAINTDTAVDTAAETASDLNGDQTGDDADEADDRGVHESLDLYNRIIDVPPESLKIDANIRLNNLEPTREEVNDYKQFGVEDAIKAYFNADGDLVILKGERRVRTAIKAGVESVPVWVRPPLSEDEKKARIERVSNQYRWTRHRKGLTRADEFNAFQQLQLDGLSVTAIGKTLSVPRREVSNALKVGRSKLAAAAADKYDLTLEQAAEIEACERAGDLEDAKALITCVAEGPHNFKTLVQRLRNDRAAAEKLRKSVAACTEQLTAAGVVILDDSIPDWNGDTRSLDRLRPEPDSEAGTELTADEHATCPGHSAWIREAVDDDGDKIAAPAYGCSDFRAHGHALRNAPAGWIDYNTPSGTTDSDSDLASDAFSGDGDDLSAASRTGFASAVATKDTSEMDGVVDAEAAYAAHLAAEMQRRRTEIESAWVENNTADAVAAQQVRQEWLAGFVHRKSIPKGARKWLALRTLAASYALNEAMNTGHPLAHRLLGLPEPEMSNDDWTVENAYERSELYDRIDAASDAKAAVYELYLMLCAYEQAFRPDSSWRTPTETDQVHIRMLIQLGYEAPDIDRKVLSPDNLDDIIAAELGTDSDQTTEHAPTDQDDEADDVQSEAEFDIAAPDQPLASTGDDAAGDDASGDRADGSTDEGIVTVARAADGSTEGDAPRVMSSDQDGPPADVDLAA